MSESSDALRRLQELCAAAEGPQERIYLLEREDPGQPRRPGSRSVARGAGPGAPATDGLEHVITLDLDELPELQGRLGGRLLALYTRDIASGESWDTTRLCVLDEGEPQGGAPLWVVPVEVPSAIFDADAAYADPILDELRQLVFNRPGWVLGRPIYIQEDEDEDGFLLQLASHIGGLNLGDAGSLYVFEGGCFMQCA